ncbi:MAG: 5-formaminoimidazole-4-carboxamide-1-beta-D-ribofuranosyl 5'-monophosphate synthetase [Candidatus Methanohalarchaeum thermophilum]|uniref:5-formaminoimidazole-4-carboxamide-1-(beta)-D-ribofuranosyl 5'-monophosphate synthetase n=1 Tax=Methanohalarchaeum thermophilum TaxID=1903181 RepID=A0A1Q6DXV5_METT1|nr:MAG: 5-formaminoimidazole-4-carboxamide-1-beta-D-ribofuranosyl 5'-monophosphate synthetase [Candidatus Methanohalarchaeum thermophilum]
MGISEIIKDYDRNKLTIGTIGSHSALNILRGAKDLGFNTLCVCEKKSKITYDRFDVADKFIVVEDYEEILKNQNIKKLKKNNTILVPHGSFNAYLGQKVLDLAVPYFGNREILTWETDREKQRKWLKKANIKLPETYEDPSEIGDNLVIAKFPGAKGGKGYFIADSEESFHEKADEMQKKGHITEKEKENIHLQDYIIGVNAYPQFFRSILEDEVELLGMDRRYESTVDSIGKIPAQVQEEIKPNPTYTVTGNFPMTLRESLLSELFRMGDNVVDVSSNISEPGLIGPFCLETVFTEDLEVYTFEISARIVAGSNVGIGGSPYAYTKYGKNMYMGKRIAKEIKEAVKQNKLTKILS